MTVNAREYNFDGLIGPTHNYGGLSPGNVASIGNRDQQSSPRAAAIQGLDKMAFVHRLGVGQAVLPPQSRPSLTTLRALGFFGSDEEVLVKAAKDAWHWYRLCTSASAMWTANAATVAPASDTADGRLHLVPANLQTMFHRAIEADTTTTVLRTIFADPAHFAVHAPLPGGGQFSDEGAANHTRLFTTQGTQHIFAYGRRTWGTGHNAAGESAAAETSPQRYPARQSREASEAVARLLQVREGQALFAQQHPDGIDAGAFHTDVLAVGHGRFFMLHELAFADRERVIERLKVQLGPELKVVVASQNELPASDAVKAYPFNSQVLTLPSGEMCIVAPDDAEQSPTARRFLERVVAEDNPVTAVHYLNVRQSMQNGGGPACLRQRIVLNEDAQRAVTARVFIDETLLEELRHWVEKHYRERLLPADIADPSLYREQMTALDQLTQILRLGSVYDFQRS